MLCSRTPTYEYTAIAHRHARHRADLYQHPPSTENANTPSHIHFDNGADPHPNAPSNQHASRHADCYPNPHPSSARGCALDL